MPHIGIDEKAFRKGHCYITLIYDLDRSTVDAISDGNDIHVGNTAFSQLSEEQLARVEAIVTKLPANSRISKSFGMAVISLLLASTTACPRLM